MHVCMCCVFVCSIYDESKGKHLIAGFAQRWKFEDKTSHPSGGSAAGCFCFLFSRGHV